MRVISCHFPYKLIDDLNDLVRLGYFPSRSEAIRVAVRDLVGKELGDKEEVRPFYEKDGSLKGWTIIEKVIE